MLRRFLSVMLVGLLMNLAAGAAYARSQDDERARRIAKVKENVAKLGVGVEARVEVKLEDGRKLKGYIQEASEFSFVVVEEKRGLPTTVAYAQVTKIKGKNGLTAAKVGINIAKGVGIVAGVAGAFTLLMYIFLPRT